jgi:hypothetical protein
VIQKMATPGMVRVAHPTPAQLLNLEHVEDQP